MSLCTVLCNSFYCEKLFCEVGLEKSTAWRHRMSLNVWLKLMDCFHLLRPCPDLSYSLPHPIYSATSLSLSSSNPPLYCCLLLVQTSLFTFSHPHFYSLVFVPRDAEAQEAGSIWQMYIKHSRACGWQAFVWGQCSKNTKAQASVGFAQSDDGCTSTCTKTHTELGPYTQISSYSSWAVAFFF